MTSDRSDQLSKHSFFLSLEAVRPQSIKHMVLGLDFDGCTDTCVARAKLSDSVANFVVDHPEIERLDVIISSLRQTFLLDYFNAHYNGRDDQGRHQSCAAIEEELLNAMDWKIDLLFKRNRINQPAPMIRFHPLLMSDIYNGFECGTTFAKIKEFQHYLPELVKKTNVVQANNFLGQSIFIAKYNRTKRVFEPFTTPYGSYECSDTSKVLTLWVQLQYFSNLYGADQPFVFRFVDDKPKTIQKVTDFFAQYPDLVPRAMIWTHPPF